MTNCPASDALTNRTADVDPVHALPAAAGPASKTGGPLLITAGDIVLLALARDDDDAARVKDFHLSLHYGEDRVGQVLKELVHVGYFDDPEGRAA